MRATHRSENESFGRRSEQRRDAYRMLRGAAYDLDRAGFDELVNAPATLTIDRINAIVTNLTDVRSEISARLGEIFEAVAMEARRQVRLRAGEPEEAPVGE